MSANRLRAITALMLCCFAISCASPQRVTYGRLKALDASVLEDLYYIGSNRRGHHFRNDSFGYKSYYWIPREELRMPKEMPLHRSGRGVPAGIADEHFTVTIRAKQSAPRSLSVKKL